jgi:neutral ceramidase
MPTPSAPPLLSGFGRADLTPDTPCFLAGYPHVARTATGLHDPLLASALVLESAGTRVALVSIDWLFVSAEWVRLCRERVASATGIPARAVLIAATHTHSGPLTAEVLAWREDPVVPPPDPDYLEESLRRVTEAVAEAVRSLRPAEARWVRADVAGIAGGNRIDPRGAEDPEAGLLVLRDAGGGPVRQLLTVYGMHPTVLHEDSTLYSSDFIHYTRDHLENAFPGARVVYLNGVCGNQSPRRVVRGQTFSEAERIGVALGGKMAEAIRTAPPVSTGGGFEIEVLSAGLSLRGKHFPDPGTAREKLEAARLREQHLRASGAGHAEVRTAECTVFGAEEVYTLAKAEAEGAVEALRQRYAQAEVQVIRLGPCALTAWPGEFFAEYALSLKEAAPLPVFPVSLANGELQGYVVTPEAEAAEGYEAQMSLFPAETGGAFVRETLRLLHRLTGLPEPR